MKKTKVPIIVSGFLWVTNIGRLQVAKNLLKGRGSMAKYKIYLCENIFHTIKTYIQNLSVVFYMLIIRNRQAANLIYGFKPRYKGRGGS